MRRESSYRSAGTRSVHGDGFAVDRVAGVGDVHAPAVDASGLGGRERGRDREECPGFSVSFVVVVVGADNVVNAIFADCGEDALVGFVVVEELLEALLVREGVM